ncbi:fasciclin [Mesorhizobium sp. L-8-10]|uniref:fasciclin domain-containing protein n=1 Tax=unclassified Mesorhizobium TaxID=325217 RepID=UPI00192712EC|nr:MULTISPECIES: fasciclin domain-containing protein [unclassified Mesorhizobium]BCH27906.1 fasciclin [Mesorhizobium sp. L-8-3]BCH35800.1 fasciclin [Mesorhizobium sp. L-8-10]
MNRLIASVLFGAAIFSAGASVAYAANPQVGGAPMYASKNIVENAVNSKDHTTLVAAVKAAGLVETLQGAGPFTVLAPTDAAFDALPKGTVEALLKPENKDQLVKILTCHVVPAKAFAKDIVSMVDADKGAHPVKTVGGCVWTAKHDGGGRIMITDENGNMADITIADVEQSNGVIHVIDRVLLPKM